MEVNTNGTYGQEQTLELSRHGTLVSVEGQSCEKHTRQLEPGLEENTESGVGSPIQVS